MLVKLENLWRQYVFPVVQNLAQLVYRLLSPLPEKARLPVSIISGSVLFYALMVVTNPKTKTFEPRLVMPFSISYDHRVIDGATAARFTATFATALSDVSAFKD